MQNLMFSFVLDILRRCWSFARLVRLPAFAAMEVFLADKILSNYYSQGGGPGVCETLNLDTCFAASELFFK